MCETDVARTVEHVRRISKQRHIEAGEYFPPVLGIERDQILIVETIAAETAQIRVAAQCRLQVERHDLIVGMETEFR